MYVTLGDDSKNGKPHAQKPSMEHPEILNLEPGPPATRIFKLISKGGVRAVVHRVGSYDNDFSWSAGALLLGPLRHPRAF